MLCCIPTFGWASAFTSDWKNDSIRNLHTTKNTTKFHYILLYHFVNIFAFPEWLPIKIELRHRTANKNKSVPVDWSFRGIDSWKIVAIVWDLLLAIQITKRSRFQRTKRKQSKSIQDSFSQACKILPNSLQIWKLIKNAIYLTIISNCQQSLFCSFNINNCCTCGSLGFTYRSLTE